MIRLDKLTKVFGTGQGDVASVSGVTLEVPAGATCVLLGPSGCGKTTTLRMINRLVTPTSGKIYIDGKDTDTVDLLTGAILEFEKHDWFLRASLAG